MARETEITGAWEREDNKSKKHRKKSYEEGGGEDYTVRREGKLEDNKRWGRREGEGEVNDRVKILKDEN